VDQAVGISASENVLVVFDRLGSDASVTYNMLYTTLNHCITESISMSISENTVTVVKNGGSVTPADVTSKVILLDPQPS